MNAMDLRRERLEAAAGSRRGFPRAVRSDQLGVAVEMEVNELAALPNAPRSKAHKGQVILDGANLPDHIVAGINPRECDRAPVIRCWMASADAQRITSSA